MKKIKDNMIGFIASIITVIMPILAGIILWNRLPDKVALHFDFGGNPDDYYSKGFAVFGMYLIILAIHLLVAIGTAFQNEKSEGIPDKVYGLYLWICPVISIAVAVIIYGNALGAKMNVVSILMIVIGFIYLVLGNYAPKLRRNEFSGIRTKWTKESKKNWEHSNRFSGYVMFVIGIISIIMALVRYFKNMTSDWIPVVWIVLIFASVFVMIIYSGMYHVNHKNDEDY